MNIAIIGSGGDGAGMNECLYQMAKKLKGYNMTLFYRGYQGLIDDSVAEYSLNFLKNERKKGGIIIKSSRSPEFMTKRGFDKAIKTLKKHNIDVLIVMGGNGSLNGVRELINAGIKCIFIPTTIDNDIKESDYSIGFDTAISNAVDFVNKVDTSMQAFDRICIYEVMGRHCPDLANKVADLTNADYCYTSNSNFEDCLKVIKKARNKDLSPKIILQENVINAEELKKYLSENLKNADVKVAVVGYVQRGGNATKKELFMADEFAIWAIKSVKQNLYNKIVSYNNSLNSFVLKDIE